MNSLPSPPPAHRPDPAMDTLLAAAWQSIQQSPPPSLREILDAYRTKGDGDRDMLIAMLNAKAAEDQRIAALASLQKSMLDMYQPSAHPVHGQTIPPLHISEPSQSQSLYAHSHRSRSPYSSAHQYHASMPSPPPSYHHHSSRSPPPHSLDERGRPLLMLDAQDTFASSPNSRKRRRSRSPALVREHPQYRTQERDRDLPLPPSPYSSSSQSSGGSPRSRDSMAIGALLSARGEDGARRLSSSSSARDHS